MNVIYIFYAELLFTAVNIKNDVGLFEDIIYCHEF